MSSKNRRESGDLFTSDEDISQIYSDSGSSVDSDESFIVKKRTRTNKAIRIIDSEDEEDDIVLSPRTRMSMTGIRPKDLLSEDSSDVESTEEKNLSPIARASSVESNSSKYHSTHEKDMSLESSGNHTSTVRNWDKSRYSDFTRIDASDMNSWNADLSPVKEHKTSKVEDDLEDSKTRLRYSTDNSNVNDNAHSSNSDVTELHSWNAEVHSPTGNLKSPNVYSENASKIKYRYTMECEKSIKEKFSSTRVENLDSDDEHDLSHISKQDEVITIEETSGEESNDISADENKHASTLLTINERNLLQPKILNSKKSTAIKYVSQEFYNNEMMKLEELKMELMNAIKVCESIGSSLPDGGNQLRLRVEELKRQVRSAGEKFALLEVESSNQPINISDDHEPRSTANNLNWDQLSEAVNQIQPKFTGKQGLATFNNQKVLTVERLKDLHGSLENCPDENVLADDPDGLIVPLMRHQKHALAWMKWRESQRPRGGILADDMGLGKTLSMIAMILAAKNNDILLEDESSSDEEDKENCQWTQKGRRKYYSGRTLVVCPASLMRQWESEVESKTSRHKLSVCVHHGNNRDSKSKHLKTYDIVITTYNIVTRESKGNGALLGIKWNRIILDEAHAIRNHKSQSSIAVCCLRAKYRWALTGTPIQNKEMDVYALLKFLKCSPFDDFAHWKKWIDNKSLGGQQRMNTLMKSLMLRRTKVQLQENGSLKCLPERSEQLIEVNLDKDEMNVYQKIMIFSKTLFAQYLYQRAERNNDLYYTNQGNRPTYMQTKAPNEAYYKMHKKISKVHGGKEVKSHEILVLLLRLRQICCHPGLIEAMLQEEECIGNLESDSDSTQPEIDLLEQINKLSINDDSVENTNNESTGENHGAIAKASEKVLQKNNPVFNFNRASSKMKKIFEVIEKLILNSNDKAIIVSQWTSVLNILKSHLANKNIATLSLNGTVPVNKRQDIVTEFNNEKTKTKILLLSLTAGGVGLNLVGANHLLLIDLHWNPQLETQAQDRIYRVGQKKNVTIYKFMCKETVEERIKALQDKKLAIANGVLTGSKASEGSKLTIDDLKSLFGI